MKKQISLIFVALGVLLSVNANALQPGQSEPKRLYSIGDSITRAFDAFLPFDNKNLSWVNGYYGFWQQILGMPNVNSHYQRIQNAFGASGTENMMAAVSGARMDQFTNMAMGVAWRNIDYTTVLLGANDVCVDSPAALPSDAQFEHNFRSGMDQLVNYLPNGSTVLVASIPDVEQVYQAGLNKTALGVVNCKAIWSLANICQSVLADTNTEADRQYVKSRNAGYNAILQNVSAEYQNQATASGKQLFIDYNNASGSQFTHVDVSNIDCFHPSEIGQHRISQETWRNGPFSAY